MIANTLNGEVYSKLKEIIKESVRAVLADNKIVISTAFAAIIQTLKADTQMVNLIHNIPATAKANEYKHNNNSITNYLELNKDALLDLAEMNYQNLVEASANNAITTVTYSSSDRKLSLPSSALNSYNQSDTYRIDEPETHHNNECDIAD